MAATERFRLRIDMSGSLSNAIDALKGTEHPLRGAPDADDRDSAAAILEQIVEHIALLKAGKATLDDFADFYCLTPTHEQPQ